MPLNWKVKLLNKPTSYFGDTTGTIILDDLDKIASALGINKSQCFDQIINCRPVKVAIRAGEAIDGIKFWYQVETKDKNIEVEGHQHGGWGGTETAWEFRGDWWLLKVFGSWGFAWQKNLVKRMDFWGYNINEYRIWTDGRGLKGENDYTITAPTCFFTRTSSAIVGAIGAYQGELYDANLSKWENITYTKDPVDFKRWWDKVINNHWVNTFKEKYVSLDSNDAFLKIKADFDQLTKDNQDAFDKWKEANRLKKEAETARDQLKTDKTQLETDKTKLTTDLNQVNADKKAIEAERDSLKTTVANKENDIVSLKADNAKKDKDIADRDHTIKEKDKVIEANKDLPNTIINLNNQLKGKDEELGKRNETIGTLTTERDTARNERDALQKDKDDLLGEWKLDFAKDFGDNLSVDSLKSVKEALDRLDEDNGELSTQLTTAQGDKATIEKAFNDVQEIWSDNFSEYGIPLKSENLSAVKADLKDLQNENEQLKKKSQAQDTINTTWNTVFGDALGDRPTLGSINLLATKLKEKDTESANLKQQLTQQGSNNTQPSNQSNNLILEKLKAIYAEKIEEDCDRFWTDLDLSEDEADSKYNQPYENLLKTDKLNENTDTNNVVNAFKIVAMIVATEKCQGLSDEMDKKRPTAKLKEQRQKHFKRIKDFWQTTTDEIKVAITPDNNPLYLPIITDYKTSQQKLDTIITKWQ